MQSACNVVTNSCIATVGKTGMPCTSPCTTEWRQCLSVNARLCGFSDPFEECCRQMRCDPTCTNAVNFTLTSCPDYLVPQDLMCRKETMKMDMKDNVIVNVNDMVNVENMAAIFMRCPPVEIVQNTNEFVLYFDVAGCKKEDIRCRITEDPTGRKYLCVCGERREDTSIKRDRMTSCHPMWGKFCRTICLPANVNCTGNTTVTCRCEDGCLRVCIPKARVDDPTPRKFVDCPIN